MDRSRWEELLDQLMLAGFYRFTRSSEVAAARQHILETGHLYGPHFEWDEVVGRCYTADEERLVEGGVLGFLWDVAPVLQAEGVRSIVYLDQDFEPGRYAYTVNVNDLLYPMLSDEDKERAIGWIAVPLRAFALVNELLERAGSRERLYTLPAYLGQQSCAIFLSPELYALLRDTPLLPEEDKLVSIDEARSIYEV